jgi:hypothetical protein
VPMDWPSWVPHRPRELFPLSFGPPGTFPLASVGDFPLAPVSGLWLKEPFAVTEVNA